jgi:hypothetical protein
MNMSVTKAKEGAYAPSLRKTKRAGRIDCEYA